jgi:hypothetical protein
MKLVILSVSVFLVISAIAFGLMIFLDDEPPVNEQKKEEPNFLTAKERDKYLVQKEVEIDSLQSRLQRAQARYQQQVLISDSLAGIIGLNDKNVQEKNNIIENLEKEIEKQQEQLDNKGDRETRAKELAKTFESMKVKEISGIVRNLDNSTLKLIYKFTGNRFRKNILLALPADRAAVLTESIIGRK